MESKDRLLFEISELLTKAFDKSITGDQFDRLQRLISTDPKALEYYFDIISTYSCLDGIKKSDFGDNAIDQGEQFDLLESVAAGSKVDDSNVSLRGADIEEFDFDVDFDDNQFDMMSQEQLEVLEMIRNSPAVEIPKEEPKPELIQKVESNFKWFPGRPSKRKLRFLAAMAANIMVTIGYLYFFAPENIDRPVVAELADSINAEWDGEFTQPDEYGYLVQSRYRLKKGFITILLNDGAKVTVEAPAELSMLSADSMELFSGRLYAIVPERAKGFSVKAGKNKIVDLGTEFGVELDDGGNTQLHVTKGKTLLFAGLSSGSEEQIEVNAGSAKKVYGDGLVKNIDVEENKFVRRIDSKTGLVFKELSEVVLFAEKFDFDDYRADTPLNHHPKWSEIMGGVGAFVQYNGRIKDTKGEKTANPSVVRPFRLEANKVYTISLDVVNPTSGWIGLGFCRQDYATKRFSTSFKDSGIAWMSYGNSSPAISVYSGTDNESLEYITLKKENAGVKGSVYAKGGVHKTGPTTLMVKVDTAGKGDVYKVEFYQDGRKVAGPVSVASRFFHHAGFSYIPGEIETDNIDGILLDNFVITVTE